MKVFALLIAAVVVAAVGVAAQQGPAPTTGFRSISLNSGSQHLSGAGWRLKSANETIVAVPATVPGECYTDLMRAGLLADPLYRYNDLSTRWVSETDWTYTAYFDFSFVSEADAAVELVFEALTSRADVFVNGVLVGVARDAFRRKIFSLANASLQFQQNELRVVFTSPVKYMRKKYAEYSVPPGEQKPLAPGYLGGFTQPPSSPGAGNSARNYARYPQSYSGWDWGEGAMPSGITRDVYLRVYNIYSDAADAAASTSSASKKRSGPLRKLGKAPLRGETILPYAFDYVVPRMYPLPYMKGEVTAPLQDGNNAFLVVVDVHLSCANAPDGTTCFRDGAAVQAGFADLGAGNVVSTFAQITSCTNIASTSVCSAKAQVNFTARNVPTLWWPLNMQDDTSNVGQLYTLTVGILSGKGTLIQQTTRRVGFRSVELISSGDPLNYGLPPSRLKPAKPVLFFRINGIPVFARGANQVPFDNFEGRVNATLREFMLESARSAGFNILRVWGGGLYMTDSFYNWCDANGIMVWSEQRFACAPYPDDSPFLHLVHEEIKHQVRRLASHPSIVIWSANNEDMQPYGNTAAYKRLNDDTVLRTLITNDDSRPVLPASPSCGFSSGFTAAGLPAGPIDQPAPFTVTPWPCDSPTSGYPAHGHDTHYYNYEKCNQSSGDSPSIFPKSSFGSEFGFQSLPLLDVWRQVSNAADGDNQFWSGLMVHRQHHPQGQSQMQALIMQNFNVTHAFFDNASSEAFARVIYLSQLQQSICIGGEARYYRRARDLPQRTMGSMYWQLQTTWQAPSWTSIERSVDPAAGINGGSWKLLHYVMEDAYRRVIMVPYVNKSAATGGRELLSLHVITDLLGSTSKYELYCLAGVKVFLYPSTLARAPTTPDEFFFDRVRGVFFEPLRGYTPYHRDIADFRGAPQCAGVHCIAVFESSCAAELQDVNPEPAVFALDAWKNIPLARSDISVALVNASSAGGVVVALSASALSPFVYVSAPYPYSSLGRWSRNGFLMVPGRPVTLAFTCIKATGSWCDTGALNAQAFAAGIRVEKLNN